MHRVCLPAQMVRDGMHRIRGELNMNRRPKSSIVLTITVLLLITGMASFGNGFRNPPPGAPALGMTGGKVAFIDDPSAVSINPANMALLDESGLMASLTLVRSRAEFTDLMGNSVKTRDAHKWLPNAHAIWALDESDWTAGVGVTTPYGQSTVWPSDGLFRYTAPYFAELTVVDINPSVARRINDRLSAGVGISVLYSELDIKSIVPWWGMLGKAPSPALDGRVRFEGDGFGVGANAGITVQLPAHQRVALTYRSAFNIDYEGDTRVSDIPAPLQGGVAGRSDFETTIRFPSIVALGYGIELTEDIRIGMDVEWIEFSRYKTLSLDAGVNNAAGFGQDIPQDWKDTWTVGLGADWRVAPQWTVRTSYLYMESPIPSRTVAPTLPDADRHLISVGCSYALRTGSIDLAYAYSIFDDLEVRNEDNPPYSGDYDLSSHLLQISYRHAF